MTGANTECTSGVGWKASFEKAGVAQGVDEYEMCEQCGRHEHEGCLRAVLRREQCGWDQVREERGDPFVQFDLQCQHPSDAARHLAARGRAQAAPRRMTVRRT